MQLNEMAISIKGNQQSGWLKNVFLQEYHVFHFRCFCIYETLDSRERIR